MAKKSRFYINIVCTVGSEIRFSNTVTFNNRPDLSTITGYLKRHKHIAEDAKPTFVINGTEVTDKSTLLLSNSNVAVHVA